MNPWFGSTVKSRGKVLAACGQRFARKHEDAEGNRMDKSKREKLEARGWKVGGVEEFLELSDEEVVYIEVKIALSRHVRERRPSSRLTQEEVANIIGSSQSRVAKMEAGDPTVTIDLLVKTLVALGASRSELGQIIGQEMPAPPQ